MTGVKCWTCPRILMARRIEQPRLNKDKQVASGVKTTVVVTCLTCQASYQLTMEKL